MPAIPAPIVSLCELAIDRLDTLSYEATLKVDYIVGELLYKPREDADVRLLATTLARILRVPSPAAEI